MPVSLLNVPRIAQRERTDCLPTCVEMVLAYQGRVVDIRWLRRVLESTAMGTPGFKVFNLVRHGYHVVYSTATDERVLIQALIEGIPPIVLLATGNLHYWTVETAHAVVVVGVEDNTVIVNDPVFPETAQEISKDEFMLAWSDFDYLYALIRFDLE